MCQHLVIYVPWFCWKHIVHHILYILASRRCMLTLDHCNFGQGWGVMLLFFCSMSWVLESEGRGSTSSGPFAATYHSRVEVRYYIYWFYHGVTYVIMMTWLYHGDSGKLVQGNTFFTHERILHNFFYNACFLGGHYLIAWNPLLDFR